MDSNHGKSNHREDPINIAHANQLYDFPVGQLNPDMPTTSQAADDCPCAKVFPGQLRALASTHQRPATMLCIRVSGCRIFVQRPDLELKISYCLIVLSRFIYLLLIALLNPLSPIFLYSCEGETRKRETNGLGHRSNAKAARLPECLPVLLACLLACLRFHSVGVLIG